MSKVEMSRINHHLPRVLHKQIRDIAFNKGISTTIAINTAIEAYVNSIGSEPAATSSQPVKLDSNKPYEGLTFEEEVAKRMSWSTEKGIERDELETRTAIATRRHIKIDDEGKEASQ